MSSKPTYRNRIGMFDLLKGIGMIIVVAAHTIEMYSLPADSPIFLPLVTFIKVGSAGIMPVFLIISGFGFRKVPTLKCIRQQVGYLVVPYLYTMLAATFFHCLFHFATFRWWPGAVAETIKVVRGFALGVPVSMSVFGMDAFSCGPVWFLLVLFISWCTMNAIVEYTPEKWNIPVILVAATAGCLLSKNGILFFCIPQGLSAVPFLYLGWRVKKSKLLTKPFDKRLLCGIWLSVLLTAVLTIGYGKEDVMYAGIWSLGTISIVMDGLIGLGSIRLLMPLTQLEGWLCEWLEPLGRYSLYIFCVHTVEIRAIPWYILVDCFQEHPVVGCLLQLVLRSILIGFVCVVLVQRSAIAGYCRKIISRK